MNRITQKFRELQSAQKKAFIAFITAGDPDLATTEKLVLAFEKAGVDIIELGVPFSDPLADGPTIQAASQRALTKHVNLEKILELVSRIRKTSQIPLALMTYYNPVFHMGDETFVKRAVFAGVDAVIIPDLPPDEAKNLIHFSHQYDLKNVFFVAPTTQDHRLAKISKASSGFIYYVSLTGVTGERKDLPKTFVEHVKRIKKQTTSPVCVGFGVSTAEQVISVAKVADGVIVGSAIVKEILKHSGKKDLVSHVAKFVSHLSHVCHQ